MSDPWAGLRKYVRLDEGHCLMCISEATGITMFPPDTPSIRCDRHQAELDEWNRSAQEQAAGRKCRYAEWLVNEAPRCRRCDEPLPLSARFDARYCSSCSRVGAHPAHSA